MRNEFDRKRQANRERTDPGYISQSLEKRFSPGGSAEREFGFRGFHGIVADVGARDGRNVAFLKRYGAEEVFGIDPDREALEKAVAQGFLDNEHAIPARLEDIAQQYKNTFDVAAVFNIEPSIVVNTDFADFAKALEAILKPQGQAAITFIEAYTARQARPTLQTFFDVTHEVIGDRRVDNPNNFLFIVTKKE